MKEIKVVNNTPKTRPDEYDEVTGIKEVQQQVSYKNKCNRQILNNYLISGYDTPVLENHKFCPNLTYNCCTEKDIDVIMENWNETFRTRIQKYYSVYINSIRYLLGYHEQINILASQVRERLNQNLVPQPLNSEGEPHEVETHLQQKMNTKCLNTSKEFLDLKFDRSFVTLLLNSAVRLINGMMQIRSSFFCTLCDGQAQEMLKSFWENGNTNVMNTVFYSKDFCTQFVEDTVDGTYNYVFILSDYLDRMKTIVECFLGEQSEKFKETYSNLKFYLSPDYDTHTVKECFARKEHGILEHCEKYCNQFNMSKINKMIEGDATQMFKYVDFLHARKNVIFKNFTNIFVNDASYTYNLISDDYEDSQEVYMFFVPSHQKKLLDEMNSDVLALGGINPYDSGVDNRFNIILAGASLVKILTATVLFLLWA